jgi:hypothetical protein
MSTYTLNRAWENWARRAGRPALITDEERREMK